MDAMKQYEIYVSFYGKQAFCFLGNLAKYEWKCHNQFTCQQFVNTMKAGLRYIRTSLSA